MKLILALALLALSACSSAQLEVRGKARDQLADLQFVEAEKTLQDPKIIGDAKNRLLTLLELGTVAHYAGNFEKSNIYFFKAKEVFRELYTSSIREGLATGLLNDNSASYTGMDFEISLLHYYIVTNFLNLSEAASLPAWNQAPLMASGQPVIPELGAAARVLSNRDRQDYLLKARAELLDWNSFLGEVRESNRGQPYYKDDLLNKVFAAYVHRLVGTNQDQGIATSLYKDASDVLVRAYCAYPSFNSSWSAFVDNYKKFPDLGIDVVKQRFIHASDNYNITDAAIANAAKKDSNSMVLVEYGEIPKRVEKHFVIGISTLTSQIQDPHLRAQVEQIGVQTIMQLAPAFGLSVVSAAVVGAATDHAANGSNPHYLSEAVDSAIGFEFKLPKIEAYPATESMKLRLRAAVGGAVITLPVAILSPLADIARLNVEARANAIGLKTGLRVGAKYLVALLPAIATYKKLEGSPDFIRMIAASAVWMAGKKVVDASEQADLRSWDFLPRWIGAVEAKLVPGNYGLALVRTENNGEKEIPIGSLVVPASGMNVREFRVFSNGKVAFP